MRASGILMHISSLPSDYGIGTMGEEAYKFIDFLKESDQKYWQVLPINPTSYGDSPYQSPSAFAGNPYFIDLDILIKKGLLQKHETDNCYFGEDEERVDYSLLFQNKYPLLKRAYQRFEKTEDFYKFCEENAFWLDDFGLFMAIKEEKNYTSWTCWEDNYKHREENTIKEAKERLRDVIDFYKFLQYEFFSQWEDMKKYANEKGIEIIGDMPIYMALDNAEVWSMPQYFCMDEEKNPTKVAGCPPDAFSEDGQLWGNPIYRWDVMEQDGFSWWIKRIKLAFKFFDKLRIDHFRGFESYYEVETGAPDAINGEWKKGPGMKLFNKIKESLGDVSIIAEDLGILTDDVRELLAKSGYPGMKILQFAFNPYDTSLYLPHNHIKNCVVYTGTHDNDTTLGWYKKLTDDERAFVNDYLRVKDESEINDAMIKTAMASVADTVIVPIQDYLKLDSWARMNAPATTGTNWQFRMKKGAQTPELTEKIKKITHTYRR